MIERALPRTMIIGTRSGGFKQRMYSSWRC